jgi:hypothetical protein
LAPNTNTLILGHKPFHSLSNFRTFPASTHPSSLSSNSLHSIHPFPVYFLVPIDGFLFAIFPTFSRKYIGKKASQPSITQRERKRKIHGKYGEGRAQKLIDQKQNLQTVNSTLLLLFNYILIIIF